MNQSELERAHNISESFSSNDLRVKSMENGVGQAHESTGSVGTTEII